MIFGKEEVTPVPDKAKNSMYTSDIIVNRFINSDEPPPYDVSQSYMPSQPVAASGDESGSTSAPASHPPMPVRSTSVLQPTSVQRVNGISLFSRHNPISGTFLVDPLLPPSPLIERKHAKNMGHDSGSRWFARGRTHELNAAFRTRHSTIKLNLAVVGSPVSSELHDKTNRMRGRIMASSRHGNISVNLSELHVSRSVDLDVSMCSGSIVLFLPPTFNGTVCLLQRRGTANFLPEFAARANLARATDREKLMVLESAEVPDGQHRSQDDDADCCIISTRRGKVTIGLSGLDALPVPIDGGGLLKLLNTYVQAGAKVIEASLNGK
ncbi:hypothetical protein B0H21DRAFT_883742 [Amylocystis lapponica]|nr:hypothetical protein B0H21DRAFT_883742 [Amylocystis lapponica]